MDKSTLGSSLGAIIIIRCHVDDVLLSMILAEGRLISATRG